LDTITSLILLMLTMLPSLCLISSQQTLSSNQCLCCYTGLKLSWPKTAKRGCRWPAVENPHRWCTSWRSRGVRGVYLPWQ